MRELVAEGTAEAAQAGRAQTLSALGQSPAPFPDQVTNAIKDRVFEASARTMARLVGNATANLEKSAGDGLGIKDAARNLRKEFKNMREFELRRVARTEINRAQQDAAELTEIELGVTFHQWITGSDERVRGSHRAQHNEVARVGQPFSNGLRRPLESGAPLGEVVNCRCRIAPWIMPEGFRAPTGKRLALKAFFPGEIVEIGGGIQQDPNTMTPQELRIAQKEWRGSSLDDTTFEEVEAIEEYTSSSFNDINSFLRQGGTEDFGALSVDELREEVDLIQTALERNPTTVPMTVRRAVETSSFRGLPGVQIPDPTSLGDPTDLFSLTGTVLSDKAFMSTTSSQTLAGILVEKEVILEMNLPVGTPAAFIKSISAFSQESEVLLGKDTKFVVTEVLAPSQKPFRRLQEQTQDAWILKVDVIP